MISLLELMAIITQIAMDTISKLTFRGFLLGQQGLWPGRRFKGLSGVESALHQMEVLSLTR
jgi:hypothetical protein